ncbi:MAG: monovalent cation/H+ antiporter subunit D family protein [Firmicutes bacterium]|nr:monovalent cation/H+ antiporter subunit D family protein [Bacillota bacterium]
MVLASPQPFWAILLPVIGAIAIRLTNDYNARLRNILAVTSISLVFITVAGMLPSILAGKTIEFGLLQMLGSVGIFFRVDALGMVFSLVASALWILSTIYSIGYMSREHNQKSYFVFFVLSCSAIMGIAYASNLFTLYIFYEYLTICTYPLVVHTQTTEATRAGIKYICYGLAGDALLFVSLFLINYLAGTLEFMPGGIFSSIAGDKTDLLTILFILLTAGFGIKAAIIPLHSWLPGAMAAPTPVSALLHAVAVVKAGVFGILRVLYFLYGVQLLSVLKATDILAIVVGSTIIIGSIMAIKQDILKLRLAYSTIGQLGYITLGALMLNPAGLTGSLVHIINHALLKITLFFCAGAIITVTGKTRINDLHGIGRTMPLTMLAFTIGSLGLMGIVPINGYISKYYLLAGGLESGKAIFAYIILASSLLNAIYYLPIIINAYFKKGLFEKPKLFEAPPTMLVPIILLAVICIALGLFAGSTTIPFVEPIVNSVF